MVNPQNTRRFFWLISSAGRPYSHPRTHTSPAAVVFDWFLASVRVPHEAKIWPIAASWTGFTIFTYQVRCGGLLSASRTLFYFCLAPSITWCQSLIAPPCLSICHRKEYDWVTIICRSLDMRSTCAGHCSFCTFGWPAGNCQWKSGSGHGIGRVPEFGNNWDDRWCW